MNYATLQSEAEALEIKATELREQAEAQHKEATKKNIKAWLGYNFESSSGLTEEFAAFSRQIKRELVKLMTGYELIDYNRMHFEFSAFFKNTKTSKLIYISCFDVRFFPDGWYNDLLIRTATHEKDYTGGANHYATLASLKEKADNLTQ